MLKGRGRYAEREEGVRKGRGRYAEACSQVGMRKEEGSQVTEGGRKNFLRKVVKVCDKREEDMRKE